MPIPAMPTRATTIALLEMLATFCIAVLNARRARYFMSA